MIGTPEQKQIQVRSIGQYIKKSSFESLTNRHELAKFKDQNPSINFGIGTKQEKLSETDHEVALHIEVVSKIGEKSEDIFKVQLEYAGVFRIEGKIEESAKEEILLVHCVTLLFPFARKEIAEITLGGGFQAVMLDPIDFRSAYLQYKQKLANENQKLASTSETVQFNN